MEKDFAWFKEHYEALQAEYGDSFLAIKDQCVIGVFNSYADGVREIAQREKIGTFIIQECSSQRKAYCCHIASTNFA